MNEELFCNDYCEKVDANACCGLCKNKDTCEDVCCFLDEDNFDYKDCPDLSKELI